MTDSKSNGSIENIFELEVDDNNAILSLVVLGNFTKLSLPRVVWTNALITQRFRSRVDKTDFYGQLCKHHELNNWFLVTDKRTSLNSRISQMQNIFIFDKSIKCSFKRNTDGEKQFFSCFPCNRECFYVNLCKFRQEGLTCVAHKFRRWLRRSLRRLIICTRLDLLLPPSINLLKLLTTNGRTWFLIETSTMLITC